VLIAAADGARDLALPATAAISVVTIGELSAGVLLAREDSIRDARRRRLDAVRAAFQPLAVDEVVAERYGELLALARSGGRSAKASDLLILATAATAERVLYTLDTAQARLGEAAGIPVGGV